MSDLYLSLEPDADEKLVHGLNPSIINKTVVIQTFKKENGPALGQKPFAKLVGILKAYAIWDDVIGIRLDGGAGWERFKIAEFYMEVFVHDN